MPTSSSSIEIAVVVVTYNSSVPLPACISALAAGLEGVDRWRLVVVDNDSADGTVGLVRELAPHAQVIEMGWNSGYAAAINRAVNEAPEAEHILILNPDARLAKRAAADLRKALERPGAGIAVPRLVGETGELHLSLRREPTPLRAAAEAVLGGRRASRVARLGEVVGDVREYSREHAVDWASGAVMLVSRRCLELVGPWDESFFLYSEETDFCLRARDAGFLTWFTPAAAAVHLGGESGINPRLWSLLTVNRVLAYRKRHGPLASSAFWLAVTAGEALRAAAGSPVHRAGLRALVRPDSVFRPRPTSDQHVPT